MSDDLCRILVEDFLKHSLGSINALVQAIKTHNPEHRKMFNYSNLKAIRGSMNF